MGEKLDKIEKIFSIPNFTPYYLQNKNDRHITGIPNANTEFAYDLNGTKIPFDTNDSDIRSIVKPSSTFVNNEYGLSLVYLRAQGKILNHIVSKGFEKI